MSEHHYLDFPFDVSEQGTIRETGISDHIKDEIIAVLLTSPGERVNLPEFGCGLRELLFSPNDEILASMVEFTIAQSLQRWLGDKIAVDGISVQNQEEKLLINIVYTIKDTLERQSIVLST